MESAELQPPSLNLFDPGRVSNASVCEVAYGPGARTPHPRSGKEEPPLNLRQQPVALKRQTTSVSKHISDIPNSPGSLGSKALDTQHKEIP